MSPGTLKWEGWEGRGGGEKRGMGGERREGRIRDKVKRLERYEG